MGRHAQHIGCIGFQQPVERRFAFGRVVKHQFAADHQHLFKRYRADMMAHGAERQDNRVAAMVPVACNGAPIGQQGVIAMHHALGLAGGAGSKGKVGDLVRIQVRQGQQDGRGAGGKRAAAGRRRQCVCARRHGKQFPHGWDGRGGIEDRMTVGIRAIAWHRKQRLALHPPKQDSDFVRSVILVHRRGAYIPVARASQENDQRFDATGQPCRHSVAAAQPGVIQNLGHAVGPVDQFAPGQAGPDIAQRAGCWPLPRVKPRQRVQRFLLPHAGKIMVAGQLRIVQGKDVLHGVDVRRALLAEF